MLSKYIYQNSKNLDIPLEEYKININNQQLHINNLVLREYFTQERNNYNYIKETMIITNFFQNRYIVIQLKSIAYIDNDTAYVNPNPITLFYKDNKWYETPDELDDNGNIIISDDLEINSRSKANPDFNNRQTICNNITLTDTPLTRLCIIDNIIVERNGELTNEIAPQMEIPGWC